MKIINNFPQKLNIVDQINDLQEMLNDKAHIEHGTHVTFSDTAPLSAGTASAGTADTVSRSDHIHPAQTSVTGSSGSCTGNAATATKWTTARTINGMSVNGTANRINYGTCYTAAATAAKTVACTGFTLITGSEITVKFTTTNTASYPTLNVNSTGAKSIYYKGSAITANYLKANGTYTFRYNGTQYDLVGDIHVSSTTSTTNTTGTFQTVWTGNATTTGTFTIPWEVYNNKNGSIILLVNAYDTRYVTNNTNLAGATVPCIPSRAMLVGIDAHYLQLGYYYNLSGVSIYDYSSATYNHGNLVVHHMLTNAGLTISVYSGYSDTITSNYSNSLYITSVAVLN